MSYSKLAMKGAIWSLLQVLAERFTQTVVMLTAALFLGPHEFGVAAMATAPAIVTAATLQSGNQLVIQRDEATPAFLDTAFSLFLWLGVLAAVAIAALAFVFRMMPGYDAVYLMILPTALAPLAAGVGVVAEGLLERSFNYRVLAVRKTVGQAIAGVACCTLAVLGFGAWSIVVQVTVAPVISTAISIAASGWRPQRLAGFDAMKELTRFSGALLGFSAMNQINIRSVDVIVGFIAGPTATGVFRLARTVLDLAVSLFLNPINNTLLPIFSRMVEDRQRTVEAMWRACGITSLVASVPFVASAFAGPYVAELVFKDKWPHLAQMITILLISLPLIAVVVPMQTYLVAIGRPKLAFFNNVIQTTMNIAFIWVGAYFGVLAAGTAFVIRCFLGGGILIYVITRLVPEIRVARDVVMSLPTVLGLAVVAVVSSLVWAANLDLNHLGPALSATMLALLLYGGMALAFFRDRLITVFAAIKSKR
ncbi:oligosaccharide flippase family protein [Novosphingobium pokkalii]|uniref:Oligosaccharide flippase family protein n=2 Tax=Novosphingobium pokkalii TaxID=1770194 RepID=A0ABV7VAY4_9SPHN|nr:succinoglycan biosynthesis transport protein ExoT [Novosphingobium pokkalii]